MIQVDEREVIRRAYYDENKSIRRIARELKRSRVTIEKMLDTTEPPVYARRVNQPAPVLGEYKAMIDALLEESQRLPRKQRYTARKVYQMIQAQGYTGAESTVRGYVAGWRAAHNPPPVFLPLEFDQGQDAQVDWFEAVAIINGESVTVQVFLMRLNYSRRCFVCAYPTQNQESFFDGHVRAFHFFGGVPRRVTYDNLKTAVLAVLQGRKREEQHAFIALRSHYLFESRFCTPGQGHEKGGVEHNVGFGRRNFMVPVPRVASFAELNAHLLAECLANDQRQVKGQPVTIGEAWAEERPCLRPLPAHDYACCVTVPVKLTPYSQVIFQTNRYSVPVDEARRQLVVRAYPFEVQVVYDSQVIATHARCYGREQDVFDPLHYLPLLEQRPGAFDHAKPIRRWRDQWPTSYETLLQKFQERYPDGQGVREFVKVLKLHRDHPAEQVAQAVHMALTQNALTADGVRLCLREVCNPIIPPAPLDLSDQPRLHNIHTRQPDLACYDWLLRQGGR